MRCVCARIRTSFSCISICNLSARLEKAPVLRRLFLWEGETDPAMAGSVNLGWRKGSGGSRILPSADLFRPALQLNRRFLVRAMSDPASPGRFPALRIYYDHVGFGRQQTARRVLPAIETDC
jgi:hypothetical protein